MKINFHDFVITDNSRECDENTIFLATRQNEKYINDVKSNGVKCIINTFDLQKLFNIKDINIIGLTGTNGKTTTAAAIYSILLDLGESVAFQGTRGYFINNKQIEEKSLTTPSLLRTLVNLKKAKDKGCKYFIMEVSSHAISQNRIEGLKFTLKIFTNISQDHLDYHKNMSEYMRVKSSFFNDDSKKLINKDGGKINFNIKNAYTYSLEFPATYKIEAYSTHNGLQAMIKHFNEFYEFSSPLVGLFNLYNITAAIAAVDLIHNSSLKEITSVVDNFAGVSGRMQILSQCPLVIVDFAHTPDGMEKVLESVKDKDISVVFGAGGDRDKSKRALMGKIASRYAKKIYITSDNPRSEDPLEIIKDIAEGVSDPNTLVIPDRKKAIKIALQNLEPSGVLMILGKGDEEYQEINGKKISFSDIKTVNSLI